MGALSVPIQMLTQITPIIVMIVSISDTVHIVAACATHAKAPAVLALDAVWAREYAAKGFRLMAYGVDQLLLQDALGRGLDLLRDAFHEADADKGSPT